MNRVPRRKYYESMLTNKKQKRTSYKRKPKRRTQKGKQKPKIGTQGRTQMEIKNLHPKKPWQENVKAGPRVHLRLTHRSTNEIHQETDSSQIPFPLVRELEERRKLLWIL